jgi:4,5-DOPA dioxygenase extradiol
MGAPPTIHDFGGFPPELHAIEYPAPGDPELAARIAELLSPVPVALDLEWGLDHGAWSVLRHVFPDASVPIVQLAIDRARPPDFHYELGQRLAALRGEEILIVGSGNVVHNLRAYRWDPSTPPYGWAERFEAEVRERIVASDHESLVQYPALGVDAGLAVPSPDHYLPLLYVIAGQRPEDSIEFPVEGCDGGSISMLSVRVG